MSILDLIGRAGMSKTCTCPTPRSFGYGNHCYTCNLDLAPVQLYHTIEVRISGERLGESQSRAVKWWEGILIHLIVWTCWFSSEKPAQMIEITWERTNLDDRHRTQEN